MNSSTYRNILRVLEKWPIDATKVGTQRDFGEFIRKEIASSFNTTAQRKLDLQVWDEICESLNKIAVNHYSKLYPVSNNVKTATGLSSTDCRTALSNEFEQILEQENLSLNPIQRLTRRILRKR